MKTEPPELAGQRGTTLWGEKESRWRHWIFFLIFSCSSNVFVRWFHLHSCSSTVRPRFEAQSKMWAVTSDYLHIGLARVHSRLYHVTFLGQPTFKPESSPYFLLLSEGGDICFWWFHICVDDLGPLGFFFSHF